MRELFLDIIPLAVWALALFHHAQFMALVEVAREACSMIERGNF